MMAVQDRCPVLRAPALAEGWRGRPAARSSLGFTVAVAGARACPAAASVGGGGGEERRRARSEAAAVSVGDGGEGRRRRRVVSGGRRRSGVGESWWHYAKGGIFF